MSLPFERRDAVPAPAVRELRRVFDAAFIAPAPAEAARSESLLGIRLGGQPLAVRALELTRLVRQARIVPLPTDCPELLGIAAIRGSLIPVYDLARLLGIQPGGGAPSWMLLANPEATVALAFDQFEGRMDVAPECISANEQPQTREHATHAVRFDADVRLIIDVAAILKTIRQRAGLTAAPGRETP